MSSSMEHADQSSEITEVLNAYHNAMIEARTSDLDRLLHPEFSLVHITGYIQPKHEWLDLVWSGDFNYHRIELEQRSIGVGVIGKSSTVQGRGIFNASINGKTAPWRLQFTLELTQHKGVWMIASARYITF
ncbi:nuclear transport factor 2 family protein [Pseudomonas atagonensis]|uniref:nuclear transport factor 2 family protein n=1 Tax=Pseudomonas atagonensis TaxID=2609964 RepID=UPI00140D9444|nr:nuclear transport factor 2 family protein [Pseudomonas atagonensis]